MTAFSPSKAASARAAAVAAVERGDRTSDEVGGAGVGGWEYVNDLARLGAIRLVELVG